MSQLPFIHIGVDEPVDIGFIHFDREDSHVVSSATKQFCRSSHQSLIKTCVSHCNGVRHDDTPIREDITREIDVYGMMIKNYPDSLRRGPISIIIGRDRAKRSSSVAKYKLANEFAFIGEAFSSVSIFVDQSGFLGDAALFVASKFHLYNDGTVKIDAPFIMHGDEYITGTETPPDRYFRLVCSRSEYARLKAESAHPNRIYSKSTRVRASV